MTYSDFVPVASLAKACLDGRPFAWQALVDQCAPAVVELISDFDRLTATKRSPRELEEMAAGVFAALRADNLAALRDIPPGTNGRIYLGILVRRILHSHPHSAPAVSAADASAGGQ